MNKIVLAFDSFKGSASSYDIANCAEAAIRKELADCEIIKFPIADGGEGTIDALCRGLNTSKVTSLSHDPLMRPIEGAYAISENGKTAIIEMASVSGLTLLEPHFRNPMNTTTYGCGELILDALKRGCTNFIIGIGGSATNDAGIGVLNALGVRFYDVYNNELKPVGKNLININRIDLTNMESSLKRASFIIACDVNNPFYGENGAAHVYAAQKGANKEQIVLLDDGLEHYSRVIQQTTGIDISNIPGSGAAGGMGGGLLPFLNAKLQSGIETVLEVSKFEETVKGADLIFTGEGRVDLQTTMGKALVGILQVANKYNIPVIALAGGVESTCKLNQIGLTAVFSIQPSPVTLEESMQPDFIYTNIERVIIQILRIIKQFEKN